MSDNERLNPDEISKLENLNWSDITNELVRNKELVRPDKTTTAPKKKKGTAVIDTDSVKLEFLYDIPLAVRVEVGGKRVLIKEIFGVQLDSALEIDKSVGQPWSIYVNDVLIGSGLMPQENKQSSILPTFSSGMQFKVNLADPKRYLSLSMRLALLDEDTLNFLNQRLPIVKDIILSTLQSQTSVELSSSDGIHRLKENLLRRLNTKHVFTEKLAQLKGTAVLVKGVYFEEFILQ